MSPKCSGRQTPCSLRTPNLVSRKSLHERSLPAWRQHTVTRFTITESGSDLQMNTRAAAAHDTNLAPTGH